MKLNFTFKHLDHSEALQQYTQELMDRLGSFLLKEGQGQVCFSKSKKEFSVDISINTKQKYFRAHANHFDAYSAVDEVVEKLEKQFLKINKVNKHHKKFELSKSGRLKKLNERFEISARYRKAA